MKEEITVNDLNELLEKALGVKSVTIDEVIVFPRQIAGTLNNRTKVRVNLGDMLNLKLDIEE